MQGHSKHHHITISFITGEHLELPLQKGTAEQVKEAIFAQRGIPKNRQFLIVNGQQLHGSDRVHAGERVNLLLPLLGGSGGPVRKQKGKLAQSGLSSQKKTCRGCGKEISARSIRRHLTHGCRGGGPSNDHGDDHGNDHGGDYSEDHGFAFTHGPLQASTSIEQESEGEESPAPRRSKRRKTLSKKLREMTAAEDFVLFDEADDQSDDDNAGDKGPPGIEDWTFDLDDPKPTTNPTLPLKLQFILLFLATWQVFFNISNVALESLLTFLHHVFGMVQAGFAPTFPSSQYLFWKALGLQDDSLTCYVACPKCHRMYQEDALRSAKQTSCQSIRFPDHPQERFRGPCDEPLFKGVRYGKDIQQVPRLLFPTYSILQQLRLLYLKKGFEEMLGAVHSRQGADGVLGDIFDGRIWKENQDYLSPYNLGLMMNIDWFKPYKSKKYSVGVIYLTIMNLPREERMKKENLLIFGIIPGPSEPDPHQMANYMEPLVCELQRLEQGVSIHSEKKPISVDISARLLCIACDLPAARKIGGFMGFNAKQGCSRCKKVFERRFESSVADYSGFDLESWTPRNGQEQRAAAKATLRATSPSQLQRLESESGARYTPLFKLHSYDCVRHVVVDPMHNLFLGTAKHILKHWITDGRLTKEHLSDICAELQRIQAPNEVGRVFRKLEQAEDVDCFTADEMKIWTLTLSMALLRNRLPDADLECWSLFVQANVLLAGQAITVFDVTHAHDLLLRFCEAVEARYGPEFITPNMHLHCHLQECILDFGPPHAFWTFGFERYNGLLGDMPNSHRNIEVELLRRFSREAAVSSRGYGAELSEYSQLLDSVRERPKEGSLRDGGERGLNLMELYVNSFNPEKPALGTEEYGVAKGPFSFANLSKPRWQYLCQYYNSVYGEDSDRFVDEQIRVFNRLEVGGDIFESVKSRTETRTHVFTIWQKGTDVICYPGQIQFFFEHSLAKKGKHTFAYLVYFRAYGNNPLVSFPNDVKIFGCLFNNSHLYAESVDCIVPVQRINNQFLPVYSKKTVTVFTACPLPRRIHI